MIKIGVIMGGVSREREISFAGGRTVYDNLDKTIFEAIPIFIDSFGNFILLNWQYVYKGSIRDFYPAPQFSIHSNTSFPFQIYAESLGNLNETEQNELINAIGKKITLHELPQTIDFAFLTLHGAYGEDGSIQGLLHYIGIPYTASGILPSAIGMNKAFQKQCLQSTDFNTPNYNVIQRNEWINSDITHKKNIYNTLKEYIKLPWVSRPANQGSSIGVHALNTDNFELFCSQINDAFFIKTLTFEVWNSLQTIENEHNYINQFIDFRSHLGFPLIAQNLHNASNSETIFFHPQNLWDAIKNHFENSTQSIVFQSIDKENEVIVEQFLNGKEFSCIVLRQPNGTITALPPTEIRKGKEIFDYRSKYLPGLSRKITPIELPNEQINTIITACEKLFKYFKFNVYARIDGFINAQGTVFLNDPNTTSGMLPSSFFFHQAAEIGLNPSQFLSFIIYASIKERINENFNTYKFHTILQKLDVLLQTAQQKNTSKIKVGVFLGGYSSERHISVESGRNIFEKLSASSKYLPVPLFVTGNDTSYDIFEIPINILLKDNADDIAEKIAHYKTHPLVQKIKEECIEIFNFFGTQNALNEPFKHSFETLKHRIDIAFIALHGRPGEDGMLQSALEKYGIAYNGSGIESSQITIDKALTNQILKQNGYSFLAEQYIVEKQQYFDNKELIIATIEQKFKYPFIAKPLDDGCSSAVKKIKTRAALEAYLQLAFRNLNAELTEKERVILELKPKEEFPAKNKVLLETLIEKGNALHFLEITGGLLTHTTPQGVEYEMFEPSETLTTNEVLSLEEKFLAGEGQNITPARYYPQQPQLNPSISLKVKNDLKKAAQILNITGYCRIDAFVKITQQNEIQTFIIEANSLPGMTPATCIFHQAAINGYTPYEFINSILEEGKKRLLCNK